ncbi:hypothetical protein Tco_0536379 [Tanacetum coccineum]
MWNTTTPIVEKIDKTERLIIDGKVTLADDDGKPLTNVDFSGDHDSEDEENYENGDYDFDPYDDDMYEGQDILTRFKQYAIIWISKLLTGGDVGLTLILLTGGDVGLKAIFKLLLFLL